MSVPADPLTPYAPIRAVGSPHAPFDGILARDPAGGTVLLVDRDELAAWAGWNAPANDHVFSPLDLSRRADGHDVVLPVVTERLDRFLVRRGVDAPLTEGEKVTLGVSILRGLAAMIERPSAPAQWWLSDDGRPLLVPGAGDSDAVRASVDVLALAGDENTSGDLLGALAETISTARRRVQLVAAEDALFAAAVPEPLATDILTPARALPVRSRSDAVDVEDAPQPWWAGLASRFDGELSDTIVRALTRLRRRPRSAEPAKRRTPLLVAAAAAAVVLAAGLLWPDDPGSETATADASVVEEAAATASTPPGAAADASSVPDPTPEETLDRMLEAVRTCGDDTCRSTVWEDPSRIRSGGAIDLDARRRVITLVDDLGGVVVLRVEAADASAAPQLVTIVDAPNGWRVRDVFDIADPP